MPRTEALLAELLPSVGGLHALADDGPAALGDSRLGRVALLRAGRRALLFRSPLGVVGIRAGLASPWAEAVLESAAALAGGQRGRARAGAVEAVGRRLGGDGGARRAARGAAHGRAATSSGCDAVVEAGIAGPKGTVLVLDGAPLDRTISGTLWAAFARGGQGMASVGRVVVVPVGADALLHGLEAAARRLRAGDPRDPETEVGPLRSAAQAAEVEALVSEAVAAGAVRLCGGPLEIGGAPFYAPAVLRSVPPDARLLREPVPGPVLAVVEAGGEADAIALADRAGGTVSVWAGDTAHGERIARALRAQLTWVNEHGFAVAAGARAARALHGHAPARLAADAPAQRALASVRPGARAAPRRPPHGCCTAARASALPCCAPAARRSCASPRGWRREARRR